MKLTKTVKYNYKLTEETLEKDIDEFISHARKGDYHMDKMYGNEGLKIIKQYLRILNEKFKNNELEECKNCYHKLVPFLLWASSGEGDLFDYNDLLAMLSKDFDLIIRNYFICMIETCNIDKLTDKVAKYSASLDVYGFDSDKQILIESLNKDQLNQLGIKMPAKTLGMTKKDQEKQYIVYFLMNVAEIQEDKEKYLQLCERFGDVLNSKEFEYLKNEYEENIILAEKIDKILEELKSKINKDGPNKISSVTY